MRPLWCCLFVLSLICGVQNDNVVGLAKTTLNKLLLFVTLEGNIYAIDKQSGEVKWRIKDKPIVQVPTNIEDAINPMFLPDPRDGSLYLIGDSREPIKKLPFNIPALVSTSPCRSTDGILYTGKKKDVWYKLDPKTGNKEPVLGWDASNPTTCPINTQNFIYIGRTKYSIMMVDSKNPKRKWNVTYYDYTSTPMDKNELNNYDLVHFVSTSSGRLISMDRQLGHLLWDGDLGSPIVAAYILDPEGLISVPFTSLANHTITYLATELITSVERQKRSRQMKLYPTLYVGSHMHGLYAIPSLVDSEVVTITVTGQDGPLLLGGPYAPDVPQPYPEYPIPGRNYRMPKGLYEGKFQSVTIENNILIYTGHYNRPEYARSDYMRPHSNLLTDASSASSKTLPDNIHIEGLIGPKNRPKPNVTPVKAYKKPYGSIVNETYVNVKLWINQQENKGLKLTLIILVGCVVAMFWYLQIQVRDIQMESKTNKKVGERVAKELPNGWVQVGKISFNPEQLLGKGCEGTFVYRGEFDSRRVAVKRLLPDCFTLADREVELLRESDAHPNVIRYFCTEKDRMFCYIALELCQATLCDYIEDVLDVEIQSMDILYQVVLGLSHLHSLDIVHRDIKPQNVRLSVPNQYGDVRAMISDFGLCKKLPSGTKSFSKRSGLTGTEGWIAPEMLFNDRITKSVDLFSLGCLFYYVLSKGEHPFGDSLHRQANILKNHYTLTGLKGDVWLQQLHLLLIKSLISTQVSKRPLCSVILKYPIFWSSAKRLSFLQDVSDRIEKATPQDKLLCSLESKATQVVNYDWRFFIDEEVAKDLRKYRSYSGSSIRDLLRALRNKKHHFRELTQEAQLLLGDIPHGFLLYWMKKFPLLLVHSYVMMQQCAKEDLFKTYFHPGYKYSVQDYYKQMLDFRPVEGVQKVDNLGHFDKNATVDAKNVGLYRNLRQNVVDLDDVKLKFQDDVPAVVRSFRPYKRTQQRRKKQSDEPLVWAIKDN